MKAAVRESSQTPTLIAILLLINILIWAGVGCAVRGLHLDADEIEVNPSRAPQFSQSHSVSNTNSSPVKDESR